MLKSLVRAKSTLSISFLRNVVQNSYFLLNSNSCYYAEASKFLPSFYKIHSFYKRDKFLYLKFVTYRLYAVMKYQAFFII